MMDKSDSTNFINYTHEKVFISFVACLFLFSCSQEKIADVESGHIDPILVDSLNKTVVAYAGLISPIIQ